jgi:hypothetical protein
LGYFRDSVGINKKQKEMSKVYTKWWFNKRWATRRTIKALVKENPNWSDLGEKVQRLVKTWEK